MTAIPGGSAFDQDSAAALAIDGKVVAATREERFSRVKPDPGFPSRAIAYDLEGSGLETGDLDTRAESSARD